ncbi:MAG: phosphoribosylformylglycinamidine synthase subunit PurS [bacterium]|nr:phosphoribosylformylglycinamidine synthase subunit PurS [bacterium]
MRAKVTVYPRREILDPQGKAICNALNRVGFDEVTEVRAGKSFEIEIETTSDSTARERLQQMCSKLLSNPIVEDFELELVAEE